MTVNKGSRLVFPDAWTGDQFSPREELRAEQEQAERDEARDRLMFVDTDTGIAAERAEQDRKNQ